MAGSSVSSTVLGGQFGRIGTGGATCSKLCLFCLAPADYVPDKGTDWTKTSFKQFLWKYLIGDDMIKINEFTGNHLKNSVPPLCQLCHEKCMQLATFHVEFEHIQDEIIQVSKDLLEGWKGKDTLLSRNEYDMAVQQCSSGRPKVPSNRFIKSPEPKHEKAYPSLETLQMYQILRNPGHVRIPLSCLKSFGFSELKNMTSKNNSVAKQILAGPKIPTPSMVQANTMAAKAASLAAAKAISANRNLSISKIPALSIAQQQKRYWINDVQVEMLNPAANNNHDNEDDDYSEGELEQKYSAPQLKLALKRPPPPMKPAYNGIGNGSVPTKQTPPVPTLKKMPPLGKIPSNNTPQNLIMKRPKLETEENPSEPMVEVDEYYDDGDDAEDNNCVNFLEIVGSSGQQYEEDGSYTTDSPDDSKYYYDDENGEEMYSDGGGYEDGDNGSPGQQYYNGRPSMELEIFDGSSNQKKRKRVFVLRKGNWTQDEDEMISKIVTEAGPKNWSKVALQLGTGRTGKQIRERWTHHLNPEVNKQPWSDQEDLLLMQAHARWGNQWSRISKLLPGRTDNAVKNHWNGTLKRKAQLMQFDQQSVMDLSSIAEGSPGGEEDNELIN